MFHTSCKDDHNGLCSVYINPLWSLCYFDGIYVSAVVSLLSLHDVFTVDSGPTGAISPAVAAVCNSTYNSLSVWSYHEHKKLHWKHIFTNMHAKRHKVKIQTFSTLGLFYRTLLIFGLDNRIIGKLPNCWTTEYLEINWMLPYLFWQKLALYSKIRLFNIHKASFFCPKTGFPLQIRYHFFLNMSSVLA